MEKMSESWDIDWIYAGKGIPIKLMRSYDAIFVKSNWGWRVDRKFRKWSAFFRSPSFLVLSGSLPPPREVKALPYDHVFFETSWYKQWEKDLPSSSRAFGVNTDIYYPGVRKKEWDYLGVGALREYKRWDRLAQRPGRKLVIGEVRGPDATALKHKLQKAGVTVLDFQSPHKLREYILAAQTVYIPAELQGGGRARRVGSSCMWCFCGNRNG
jgi:hypothetical protein